MEVFVNSIYLTYFRFLDDLVELFFLAEEATTLGLTTFVAFIFLENNDSSVNTNA